MATSGGEELTCHGCLEAYNVTRPSDPACLPRSFDLAAECIETCARQHAQLVPSTLIARTHLKLDELRRQLEQSSQLPRSLEAEIEAFSQELRSKVEEHIGQLRLEVREKLATVGESRHQTVQHLHALERECLFVEELARQQLSPEEASARGAEATNRLRALLETPAEVHLLALDLTLPAWPKPMVRLVQPPGGNINVAPAGVVEAALEFPDQAAWLEGDLRCFTHIPPGNSVSLDQPLTGTRVLGWCHRLASEDDGSCPAPQLAALMGLGAIAADPEAQRAVLQAIRVVAERDAARRDRMAEVVAPVLCRLFAECCTEDGNSLAADLTAAIKTLAGSRQGPSLFGSCLEPIQQRLMARPGQPLAADLLCILVHLLPELSYSQALPWAVLFAQLLGDARFASNHRAVAQLLRAAQAMAQVRRREIRQCPQFLPYREAFRMLFQGLLAPVVRLLGNTDAMDHAPLAEGLLGFLHDVAMADGPFAASLRGAGVPRLLEDLQSHPVVMANPTLGKLP
ncbi:hypothetical protein PAPYR_10774 [Paratrimastix pyriformis]|uniref:Uncharacterized protein n=1 Tax=Paratrimastix pyriformis TaxID=342808 RepID=A0ABQ8U583_9EUKA|nr:hypothetical protein PAPYR_10774 [Paratrimastix pyriformis]